jgi:DNA-binding IscR family transcriptional regulator
MAVVDIGIHGHRPLSAEAIAAHPVAHPRFFKAVLRHLKDCDILKGHRGKNVEGFTLARASNLISAADAVLAVSKMREEADLSVDSPLGK